MNESTPAGGRLSRSLLPWSPPVIIIAGLVLGLAIPLLGIMGIWGFVAFFAYWILGVEIQRTRRAVAVQGSAPGRIAELPAATLSGIVSAALLAFGFFFLYVLTFTPVTICHGGTSCPSEGPALWPFGFLSTPQPVGLWLLLITTGLVALTVSSRLLASAQRRVGPPQAGLPSTKSTTGSV